MYFYSFHLNIYAKLFGIEPHEIVIGGRRYGLC